MKLFTKEDLARFETDDAIFHGQTIPDAVKEAFMNPPENDNVHHPDHYIHGKYETIEVLKDWLTPEEFRGFCLGNAMKYLSRWRNKGGVEDLKKATWYLNYIIKYMEGEKE